MHQIEVINYNTGKTLTNITVVESIWDLVYQPDYVLVDDDNTLHIASIHDERTERDALVNTILRQLTREAVARLQHA